MKKERNAALDVMKGIGILAMIAGHTGISSGLVGFVFVWHMPLFFLVAGYFFRPQSVAEAWKKNFRTLLIPYLLTATAMFVLCAGYSALGRDRNITNAFVAVFVGAGSRGVPVWGEYTIGAIWFLPAMFWCRIIYNHISIRISDKYKCGGVILALSVLGTYMGNHIYIPTNLLQGAGAMLFFWTGHQIAGSGIPKRMSRMEIMVGILLLLASLYSSYEGGGRDVPLSMVRCHYSYYPVNVLAALFCVHGIYIFSVYMLRWKRISDLLGYWGRISLLILCVHIIDLDYGFIDNVCVRLLGADGWLLASFLLAGHWVAALCGAWMLVRISWVRRVFRLART